jgi:hypothetical protein
MKRVLVLVATVAALASCKLPVRENQENLSIKQVRSSDDDIINTMVIDGCEYITWRRTEGIYNSFSSGIVHKGNCKNHLNK